MLKKHEKMNALKYLASLNMQSVITNREKEHLLTIIKEGEKKDLYHEMVLIFEKTKNNAAKEMLNYLMSTSEN